MRTESISCDVCGIPIPDSQSVTHIRIEYDKTYCELGEVCSSCKDSTRDKLDTLFAKAAWKKQR